MISIVKATEKDLQLLADMGGQSFIESHGSSATPEDIDAYVNEKYTTEIFRNELSDVKNVYHIISYNKQPAGYSKIVFDALHADLQTKNVTKLERLYLTKDFYDLKLGYELFKFNVELSQRNNQQGMWLYVWKENQRAVNFYKKTGFKIIGSHDFKITETHSNPNHHMFLKY